MPEEAEDLGKLAVLGIIRSSLRNCSQVQTLTEADIQIEEFENVGFSANELRRVLVNWDQPDSGLPSTLITKRWQPSSWTSWATGAKSSRETMGWIDGMLANDSMPHDFRAPFLGAHRDRTGQWIIMEDVEAELMRFRAPEDSLQKAQLLLEKLAQFHVHWEDPARCPDTNKSPWLYSQNARLRLFEDWFSVGLRKSTPDEITDEGFRDYVAENPDGVSRAQKVMKELFEFIPDADHSLWDNCLCDREELVGWGRKLSQTVIHGDLHLNNLGIRGTGSTGEILPIDWEWMGIGTPGIDVIYYLSTSIWDSTIDLEQLKSLYFSCYQSNGGTLMNLSMWKDACDLGEVYYGLCFLPIHRKAAMRMLGDEPGMRWYGTKISETSRILRKMFG